MTKRVLALYAVISAVYLLYLPHALPVLDDWTGFEIFRQGREGGPAALLNYLQRQIDNSFHAQFRMNWAGILPAFGLSYFAGSTGWPYNLFAWTTHLLTALLLYRTVALLTGDRTAGFAAGGIYSVFPPVNHLLFWSMSTSFYHLEALGLAWWFHATWKRLAETGDYRYRWTDLARLLAVIYLGEQIFPALLLLLPVTHYLFGRAADRRPFWRFWLVHASAVCLLFIVFAFFVNRMPLAASVQNRAGAVPWSLWPILPRMLAAAGIPGLAEWRPEWRLDLPLLILPLLAAVCLLAGLRSLPSVIKPHSVYVRLLLWGMAGCLLTYLPVTILALEWRYLYVPSYFVIAGGVGALSLCGVRARAVFSLAAVACGVAIGWQEMRQCWIPQSRAARAALEAVAADEPFEPGTAVILSGGPAMLGPAPAFITGASWAMRSALTPPSSPVPVEGGRDLLVSPAGQLALFRPDHRLPWRPEDLNRLRVFVYQDDRYWPKSLLALPRPDGRFRLVRLGSGQVLHEEPTMDQLRARPDFTSIYFAHPVEEAW
jgi:hypothetical protein